MRFRPVCTILLALPMVSALAAGAPQGGVQKTALVTVVAEAGGPVANLAARRLHRARGQSHARRGWSPAGDGPLFITLLVDTIRPPAGVLAPTQDLRRALTSFITTIKTGNPDAQIAILDFAGASVTAVDFTTEAPTLDRFIQRLFPNRRADAVLIEAMVDGGKKLSDKPSPVARSSRSTSTAPDSSAVQTMNQAAENIRKSGATVWTVSVRGTSTSSNREEVLNVLTRASGGMRMTVVEASGLESMLKSVANSLLSQYTVTFVRPADASVKSTQMETRKSGKVLHDAVDERDDSRQSTVGSRQSQSSITVVNHSRQSKSSVQVVSHSRQSKSYATHHAAARSSPRPRYRRRRSADGRSIRAAVGWIQDNRRRRCCRRSGARRTRWVRPEGRSGRRGGRRSAPLHGSAWPHRPAHAHHVLLGPAAGHTATRQRRRPAVTVFLAQDNARRTLESGVTTVRDLGASNDTDFAMRELTRWAR